MVSHRHLIVSIIPLSNFSGNLPEVILRQQPTYVHNQAEKRAATPPASAEKHDKNTTSPPVFGSQLACVTAIVMFLYYLVHTSLLNARIWGKQIIRLRTALWQPVVWTAATKQP